MYLSLSLFPFTKLGPWLAVEIPDLIEKSLITHKDEGRDDADDSK